MGCTRVRRDVSLNISLFFSESFGLFTIYVIVRDDHKQYHEVIENKWKFRKEHDRYCNSLMCGCLFYGSCKKKITKHEG